MSPDLRAPPDPERTPFTDAELATVESEVARLIAADDAEALFVLQERVIASSAETLRGCAAKLRVLFDPDHGLCAAAIEDREFAAVAQVVAVIERAITLAKGEEILVGDLAKGRPAMERGEIALPVDLPRKMEEMESRYIRAALERTGGNLTKAAELLGISFRSLRYIF